MLTYKQIVWKQYISTIQVFIYSDLANQVYSLKNSNMKKFLKNDITI